MTVKISLIASMLFLCGCLLVVIPPALSIRCYRMVCEGEYCYGDVGEVECQGADDDMCGTLTFTTEGAFHNVIKNCTRSTQDCNEESTCERVETVVAEWGVSFSDCSMSCCQGNMCNAPEEEFKLEEEDDRALGPIASISIHNQNKAIKAYHIMSGEGRYVALSILSTKQDGGCTFYHNTMRTLHSP
ncbi:uncharacterized protein LOC110061997 isoform X1 [Orbicella faveolata]|uniref:uncharacterized protein LOC110061997 isoform X1 n=1 Tax=Orbicella faveolata TaxID=48498 RepID=UPI0009E63B0E|nr:uncharacterized protein LOC110061997 isoform X1 [Orbicella faveolata]XP_020624530.1 uncharacterized protein LOC110061997 isoform X1 [Orbicella faveolata]